MDNPSVPGLERLAWISGAHVPSGVTSCEVRRHRPGRRILSLLLYTRQLPAAFDTQFPHVFGLLLVVHGLIMGQC